MKNDLIIFGTMLVIAGIFFTFITFGLGIVCLWPIILIGLILILLGIFIPDLTYKSKRYDEDFNFRFCKYCGKKIPYDAKYCSYCGKNFNQQ